MNQTHSTLRDAVWHPASARDTLARLSALCLLLCLPALQGCVVAGLAGVVAGTDRIPAEYDIEDRPTLVLVDDPDDQLANPSLRYTIGSHVGHHLQHNRVLRQNEPVTQRRLVNLASTIGDDFESTAVDQVGRMLDAEQVIYVRIESIRISEAPSVYRPTARLRVKVLDAAASRQLFPPTDHPQAGEGHPLVVEMFYRGSAAEQSRATEAGLARQLAERAGLQIAQLFYTHRPPEGMDD